VILEYNKNIVNTDKFHRGLKSLFPTYTVFNRSGSNVYITFSGELSQQDQDACAAYVSAFTDYTSAESLAIYLESTVYPFVKGLINSFAAENISMGITQAGKTGHVLALFSKKYPVPNSSFQNSLKSSFDTGSLYIAIDIIEYIRDNPTEFDGLSPFITDARLLAMKNKIEVFLGVPTTP
jgi:hypothetical protein